MKVRNSYFSLSVCQGNGGAIRVLIGSHFLSLPLFSYGVSLILLMHSLEAEGGVTKSLEASVPDASLKNARFAGQHLWKVSF